MNEVAVASKIKAASRKALAKAIKATRREDGTIHPEDIVEAARDPGSPLHDRFNWDDTEAAERYRVMQARELIRVVVVVSGVNRPERDVVSITTDRARGGGYRALTDVVSQKDLYATYRHDALACLRGARTRYRRVKELAAVWAAIDALDD